MLYRQKVSRHWAFHLFVFLNIIFYYSNSYSQSLWFWQNPKPQGNHLYNVQFVNSMTAFAVGEAGTIMKTTNAGVSWNITHYTGGTAKILKSLFFLDENNGWAGGYDGTLLHTTNSGESWDSVTGHTYKIVEGISFSNTLTGTIVAAFQHTLCCGSIYKTTDGGLNWINQPQPSDVQENLHDVAFASTAFGISVGLFGNILRTTDGGSNWIKQNSNTTEQLYALDNISEDLWIAAGNGGIILRSSNAGSTWTQQLNGVELFFEGIDLVDQNIGYVCGSNGAIYKTTNGGLNWFSLQSGTLNHLFDISFSDVNTGKAVGLYGTLVRTTNGGVSWVTVSEGTIKNLNAINFPTTQAGYICGEGGTILKSTNLGIVWQPIFSGVSQTLFALSFTSNEIGTAVGTSGVIIRTTNGGLNWIQQPSGVTGSGSLNGVSFVNSDIGFAVGYNAAGTGVVLKTSNGGSSWLNSPAGITNLLYAVDFLNENKGIVVGGMGAIIVTTNSGNSWMDRSLGQGYVFGSTIMLNDSFAVTAGFDAFSFPVEGVVFVTTDGGTTWASRSSGLTEPINAIWFMDENTAIAAASEGEFFRTTDGGINWVRELTGTSNNLYGVSYIGPDNTIIIGEGGTILTSNGNIPVELISFNVEAVGNNVVLNWTTSTEINNSGFEIERKYFDSEFETIGYIPGFGTTTEQKSYSFTDNNISLGSYIYRLKQVDYNGSFEYSNQIEIEVLKPDEFSLYQNFPNPFNPFTTIKYYTPGKSLIKIIVYDLLGREVTTLVNEEKVAGIYKTTFDASELSSGVYIYKITVLNGKRILFSQSKQMILLK